MITKGKNMKQTLTGIICFTAFILLYGHVADTDPQFRIKNEQSEEINVQIETSNGATVTIDDIQPGETTEFQSAPVGDIAAKAVIENVSLSPSDSFFATKNTRYTVVVISGSSPMLRIDY